MGVLACTEAEDVWYSLLAPQMPLDAMEELRMEWGPTSWVITGARGKRGELHLVLLGEFLDCQWLA